MIWPSPEQIDLSVFEIHSDWSIYTVETTDGYEQFAKFLEREFCVENILFVTEVFTIYVIGGYYYSASIIHCRSTIYIVRPIEEWVAGDRGFEGDDWWKAVVVHPYFTRVCSAMQASTKHIVRQKDGPKNETKGIPPIHKESV